MILNEVGHLDTAGDTYIRLQANQIWSYVLVGDSIKIVVVPHCLSSVIEVTPPLALIPY